MSEFEKAQKAQPSSGHASPEQFRHTEIFVGLLIKQLFSNRLLVQALLYLQTRGASIHIPRALRPENLPTRIRLACQSLPSGYFHYLLRTSAKLPRKLRAILLIEIVVCAAFELTRYAA